MVPVARSSPMPPVKMVPMRRKSRSDSSSSAEASTSDARAPTDAYPPVQRSLWNRPEVMVQTFAFLYNTIETLGVQMDESLWRKVYALPPMRNRRLNWSQLGDARQIQFIPRYQPPLEHDDVFVFPVAEFRDDQFDEGRATVSHIGVKRRHERGKTQNEVPYYARANGLFDPPVTLHDRTLRRNYVQQNDGFLCATHALNNVMNRIAFAPADTLGVIDVLRPLGNMFAQLEEVMLVALREGVLLLRVSLTMLSELVPLHDTERFPERKVFLRFVKQAGGMLVYRPSADGHFVSLIYSGDRTLPLDTPRWAIWDGKNVVTRGSTAASALERYIFRSSIIGVSDPEIIRREREASQRNYGNVLGNSFYGLLPISAETLLGYRGDVSPDVDDDDDDDENDDTDISDAEEERRLVRTLLRRFLSETTVIDTGLRAENPLNEQREEIAEAAPLSANNFDMIARDMRANNLTGRETTNPASFFAARFAVDKSLNANFDKIASLLLDLYTSNGSAPLSRFWRRELTNSIKEAASLIIDQTGIGLFFTNVRVARDNASEDEQRQAEEERRKFFTIHSNRRWFRYFVLFLVCSAVDDYIGTKPEIPKPPGVSERDNPRNNPDNDRWYVETIPARIIELLFVLCFVGFTNLTSCGEPFAKTPHISELADLLFNARDALLTPRDNVPSFLRALMTHADTEIAGEEPLTRVARINGLRQQFAHYLVFTRYDKTLWLLESAVACRLPNFALPSIEPFRLTDDARVRAADAFEGSAHFDRATFMQKTTDDGSPAYDHMAEFCTLLRTTLFQLPFGTHDYASALHNLISLRRDDVVPYEMAQHMHNAALKFVQLSQRPVIDDNDDDDDMNVRLPFPVIASEHDARDWIDIVAFDRRFTTSLWDKFANVLNARETNNVRKPRLFERALELGFDRIQRRVFGVHTVVPDNRAPIYSNPTRIPTTNAQNEMITRWTDARPYQTAQAQLSVAPLGPPEGSR